MVLLNFPRIIFIAGNSDGSDPKGIIF
ncbi:unnamed protein product [Coffea canephora]|uniref:Uncharacterized protein n=1 Tax=Coffea canephora TaxID=49390 RepID=A0A068U226_COFCA|nr:unnamed protein product [Coffea canephora]